MREYLGPHEAANQARMLRSQWAGAFLLVEGDTDARFYKRFVHRECIIVAHGKENVLGGLRILVDEAFAGVAAIVDRDLWAVGEGARPKLDGLMCTDERDLEIMVLRSPALDHVLDMYDSPQKRDALHAKGLSVTTLLLRAGTEIGYLRWLNGHHAHARHHDDGTALSPNGTLRLKFDGLDFGKFLDRGTLKVDRRKLLQTLSNHSRQPLHTERVEAALDRLRASARESGYEDWDICSGHDLVEILKIGLCRCFGTWNQGELRNLDRALLAAYGGDQFRQTALFAAMQAWSEQHPAYELLTTL